MKTNRFAIAALSLAMTAAAAFAQFPGMGAGRQASPANPQSQQIVYQLTQALYEDMTPAGQAFYVQTCTQLFQYAGNDPELLAEACEEAACDMIANSDHDCRRLGFALFHVALVCQGATPDQIIDGFGQLTEVLDSKGHSWHRRGHTGAFLSRFI